MREQVYYQNLIGRLCLRQEGLAVFALPDFRRLFHGCSQLPDTAPAVLCLLLTS